MRHGATLLSLLALSLAAPGCFADRNGLAGSDGGTQGDGGTCPGTAEECNGRDDDCDSRVDETFDLSSDPENCGACGEACPADPANASAACVSGSCEITCDAGFADCDGDPGDGCEARLDAPTSCGSCGTTCSGDTPVCAGEPPTCVDGCPIDTTDCGGSCVDLTSDPSNCGGCGNACAAPAHASASCEGSTCGFVCDTDYDDCNGDPDDGCEVDLRTDPDHCGDCATACTGGSSGTATCVDGACGFTCAPDRADCNGDPGDGCEVDLRTDPDHCGSCTTACPSGAHSTATCAARTCGITCDSADFDDCDGEAGNGCEVDLRTDPDHCGGCGDACPTGPGATATCADRTCGITCDSADRADCDGDPGNGCEADLTSPETCGSCGNECVSYARCDAGSCVTGCDPMDNCARCTGGCCEVGSCTGSCSTTASGGSCRRSYDCRDSSSCRADCSSGSSCATDCRRGNDCDLVCSGGSTCALDCTDAADCSANCSGGSSCVIDCNGATSCAAHCSGGSSCAIDCNGATSCTFADCSGGSGIVSCPGGILVCNRTCP